MVVVPPDDGRRDPGAPRVEVTPTKEIHMLQLTTTLAAAARLATAGPVLTAPGAFASGGSDDGGTHSSDGSGHDVLDEGGLR